MEKFMGNDELTEKRFNISCCRSYLTPKGRCYTCPELDETAEDLDQEEDPDQENW